MVLLLLNKTTFKSIIVVLRIMIWFCVLQSTFHRFNWIEQQVFYKTNIGINHFSQLTQLKCTIEYLFLCIAVVVVFGVLFQYLRINCIESINTVKTDINFDKHTQWILSEFLLGPTNKNAQTSLIRFQFVVVVFVVWCLYAVFIEQPQSSLLCAEFISIPTDRST